MTKAELLRTAKGQLESILSWWSDNMVDSVNGGFLGRIDGLGKPYPDSDKGVILNTRILWTFSAAARLTGLDRYAVLADRAYHYLCDYFLDEKYGGLFWMLSCDGKPVQSKKQTYAQAFGIYAFSEYYMLTGDQRSLRTAQILYQLLENKCKDISNNGYFEAYSRDWSPLEDMRLGVDDLNAPKSMNTHLHILEAYTSLYRSDPSSEVGNALKNLLLIFSDRIISGSDCHQFLFFDRDWNSLADHVSYGHDIECSWLMVEAAHEVLGKDERKRLEHLALCMASAVMNEGMNAEKGIVYEYSHERGTDFEYHWWVQAEAVVGFINAYQLSRSGEYLQAAFDTWKFIERYLLDAQNGEWYWSVSKHLRPNTEADKAGAWKAPYHNARMCMELIRRLSG